MRAHLRQEVEQGSDQQQDDQYNQTGEKAWELQGHTHINVIMMLKKLKDLIGFKGLKLLYMLWILGSWLSNQVQNLL